MNQIVRVSPVAYPAQSDSSFHEEIVELTSCTNPRSFARQLRAEGGSVSPSRRWIGDPWSCTVGDLVEQTLAVTGCDF